MAKAISRVAVGLAVSMLLLVACLAMPLSTHADAPPTVSVAIDVDTTGNSDNALGPTEACNSIPLQVGDAIDIDIVVRGVPPYNSTGTGGIAGLGLNLLFDPAVVQVDEIQSYDGPTILKADGDPIPFVLLNYDGTYTYPRRGPPGVSGNVRIDMLDLSRLFESGDGVLTRVTLKAVGDGVSRLGLQDAFEDSALPEVFRSDAIEYDVVSADAALIVGEGSCSNPTPSGFPTPTSHPGSNTPAPTVPTVPPGNRYTITLEPQTIPTNQDSIVTITASADSPGITNYSIDISLVGAVNYISCSDVAYCYYDSAPSPIVEFFSALGKPHVGNFTVGTITVHPTAPEGSTVVQFKGAIIHDSNELDLSSHLTVENGIVRTSLASPGSSLTPTSSLGATPTPTPLPTSNATPISLPPSGGAPLNGSSGWPVAALLAGTVALSTAFVLARRIPQH